MKKSLLKTGGMLAAILFFALPARAELKVVTSIPPIHSLVAKVMIGAGEPHLLLRNGQSPHDYTLRPSDARAIEKADLIVLVSHTLETFLDAAVERYSDDNGRVIEFMEAKGVTHLDVREGALWEVDDHHDHADEKHEDEHDHADEKHQGGHEGHNHGPEDPHVWLSIPNAKAFVAAIAVSLSRMDPDQAALYKANAAAALQDLDDLTETVEKKLAPLRDRPFLVFHDAYQYFETTFNLTAAGAISLGTGASPGAARLRALRQRVTDGDIRCIFKEVQFDPRLAEVVAEGSGAKLGTLDPVGSAIPFGPNAYNGLILGLADGFESCLK